MATFPKDPNAIERHIKDQQALDDSISGFLAHSDDKPTGASYRKYQELRKSNAAVSPRAVHYWYEYKIRLGDEAMTF